MLIDLWNSKLQIKYIDKNLITFKNFLNELKNSIQVLHFGKKCYVQNFYSKEILTLCIIRSKHFILFCSII